MRIFHLALGSDIAGQGAALRAACNRLRPEWIVDQMAQRERVYAWPRQHPWDATLARRLYGQADIVHLASNLSGWRIIGRERRKRLVVHHHGTEYRENRRAMDKACRAIGAAQVVSTLDLLGSPDVTWVPVVVDTDAITPRMKKPRALIRVAHSPTDREAKGTDAIAYALARERGMELDIIEGVSWAESLRRKALADVVIDQLDTGLGTGYGLAAVEAWAMGIPVVSGLNDTARMVREFGGLPFVNATAETLVDAIHCALDSRSKWGERGRAHVERFHSQAAVLARLEPVYQRMMA